MWLEQSKQRHRVDSAARSAELSIPEAWPSTGSVTFRWATGQPYLQLDHGFVFDVPEARIRAVETAIVHANNIIALPGLAFDYEHRTVHMRLAVPMYDDGMLASSLKAQLVGVLKNAADFVVAFQAIVAGRPGEQVMQLALAAATPGMGAQA